MPLCLCKHNDHNNLHGNRSFLGDKWHLPKPLLILNLANFTNHLVAPNILNFLITQIIGYKQSHKILAHSGNIWSPKEVGDG